jgi:hypothetical protein
MDPNVDEDGGAKAATTLDGVHASDQFVRCATPAPIAEREHVQSRRHNVVAEIPKLSFCLMRIPNAKLPRHLGRALQQLHVLGRLPEQDFLAPTKLHTDRQLNGGGYEAP